MNLPPNLTQHCWFSNHHPSRSGNKLYCFLQRFSRNACRFLWRVWLLFANSQEVVLNLLSDIFEQVDKMIGWMVGPFTWWCCSWLSWPDSIPEFRGRSYMCDIGNPQGYEFGVVFFTWYIKKYSSSVIPKVIVVGDPVFLNCPLGVIQEAGPSSWISSLVTDQPC